MTKGWVIILWLLCAITSAKGEVVYGNKGRGYSLFTHASQEGLVLNSLSDTISREYYSFQNPASDIDLSFRTKSLNGAKYCRWGIKVVGDKDTLTIDLDGRDIESMVESSPGVVLKRKFSSNPASEEKYYFDKINPRGEDNLWRLRIKDSEMDFSGGNTGIHPLTSAPFTGKVLGFEFYVAPSNKMRISDIKLVYNTVNPVLVDKTYPKINELDDYFIQSDDEMEGYWVIFDRELEESLIKLGGDYKLAALKSPDGYILLYIEGAGVNSGEWTPGEIKAILHNTDFEGIYDVEWFDSMKENLYSGIKAQRGEGETLLIQVPYQSSKLRLRKIKNPR